MNLKLAFRSLEECRHGNQFLLALSTKLSFSEMALAYGKKCMGADGRRRLVAKPGGLVLGFARSSASGSRGCGVISTLLPFISVNSFVETYFS